VVASPELGRSRSPNSCTRYVGHWKVDQPWLVELVARVAGRDSFKKRTPFWPYTILSFVHQEQAAEMRLYLGRHREAAARGEEAAVPDRRKIRRGGLLSVRRDLGALDRPPTRGRPGLGRWTRCTRWWLG
jgi:hypothetical protein